MVPNVSASLIAVYLCPSFFSLHITLTFTLSDFNKSGPSLLQVLQPLCYPVMCPSHFCRVSFESESSEILLSRVTKMVESLLVIGLQARVTVESYKFQTFPIYFWL